MLKKILLIEDNEGDSRLLQELLFDAHPGRYEILSAVTLQEGLMYLNGGEFDVVLTDLDLPDSDKTNTVTYIQNKNPIVPVIVLSGCESEKIAREIVQMGAQDYLIKGQGDGYLISRAIEYSIERKRNEQGLHNLAHYDHLTGLANRLLFRERLDRALIRADRHKTIVALYVIDLDRFKNVNDTLGHDAGDELLVMVANRLKNCIRAGDTVARLGGDEFTIIINDLVKIEDAAMIANKIIDVMKKPLNVSSHDIYISPSIGISLYPIDGLTAESLLKNADNAMYRAKGNGRNCFSLYTSDMSAALQSKLNLETKLRHATDKQEFVLHYQPKFSINDRKLIGAEALIRWFHPEEGMVSPSIFIPLAEEFGQISDITDWVVKEACKQNFLWQRDGYQSIRIAVNISPRYFNQDNVAKKICDLISFSGLDPKYVELEITEGALMQDVVKNNETLKVLNSKGIHISIDDFGTGYSSLSYLKRLHLNTLKIDQSFVRNVQEDPDDAAIVSAIIAMANSLNLDVIAEGIETEAQLNYLASIGCNKAQGYLLGKPLPAEEFTQFFIK